MFDYCWNSEFNTGLRETNESFEEGILIEKYDLPKDVNEIYGEIYSLTKGIFNRAKTLNERALLCPYIETLLKKVRLAFNKNDNKLSDYINIKKQLYFKIKKDILFNYRVEFILYKDLNIENEGSLKLSIPYSFTYVDIATNPIAIKDVYQGLIKGNFINKDTNFKIFKKLFTGEKVEPIIIWTGEISELAYFIKCMHSKLKKVEDTKRKHWKICQNCFQLENNTFISIQQLQYAKTPTSSKNIDKILGNL